jgi:hypothetical protein
VGHVCAFLLTGHKGVATQFWESWFTFERNVKGKVGASAALGHQDGGFPPPHPNRRQNNTYFRGFFRNGNVPLKSTEIEYQLARLAGWGGEEVNASGS